MRNLIKHIASAGGKDFTVGEEVKIVANSTGHGYPVGQKAFVTNIQRQVGYTQYIVSNVATGIQPNWWANEMDFEKVDAKRNRGETIKELSLIIELLDAVSDDEFENIDSSKLTKKYKSFKFLKLFNNAKTEAEKLSVLEEILD